MILRSAALEQLDWLDHGFGTRLSEDWPPAASNYANLRQIHSDLVKEAGPGACGQLGLGDGLVTAERGVWVGVRTADCAPVILADPVHRALAVVHAGWRGTVSRIVGKAIEEMASRYGSAAVDLVAAVGPAIGPCCFEVGGEVAGQFAPWWPERRGELASGSKQKIELAATLERQLITAGLKRANVSVVDACTKCGADRFHSFRRDQANSGRMVSAARIRPNANKAPGMKEIS